MSKLTSGSTDDWSEVANLVAAVSPGTARPVPSWETLLWFNWNNDASDVSFTHTADEIFTPAGSFVCVCTLGLKLNRRKDAADWFNNSKHCAPTAVFGVY